MWTGAPSSLSTTRSALTISVADTATERTRSAASMIVASSRQETVRCIRHAATAASGKTSRPTFTLRKCLRRTVLRVLKLSPSAPPRGSSDNLGWHRVDVQGRRAHYGVGGPPDGPPVLFLHGWALGSRAYKRAVRRLTTRGCRVYAPAMPSFGGTADLPNDRMDIGGYAAWVDAFLTEVGVDEPALVVGHSFGGGVATKLAHALPERVRYLVLLNAVGGVSPRAPWEWALGFAREMWPIPQGIEMAQAMRDDLVPNLLRNPVGLLRAGRIAQDADLVDELATIRARGTPVLVLTSDGDGVIPHAAFEALCDAVGAEGRVVSGRHSWLLADPDTFGQVLANIVEMQIADRHAVTASTRASDIAALLSAAGVPVRVARRLLRDASPLWLMSESTDALAADLALCHPKLVRGEVRAVARPIEDSTAIRLTVVASDRPGLLADSAAVLAWHRLSIVQASATTSPRGLALHALTIEPPDVFDDVAWRALGDDLRSMVASTGVTTPPFRPVGRAEVSVHGEAGDRSLVRVSVRDQLGLFSAICRWFSAGGLSIEAVHASTSVAMATDTFVVQGACDADALATFLSR